LSSVNGKHWDFIATSPMARCQAFAQHLSAIQNIELEEAEPVDGSFLDVSLIEEVN
jgi:hypothetical protein